MSLLLSLGSTLLKGVLDRNAQKKANAANSPAGQVAAWERAGINPRFGISQGQWVPQQATSLGDAFATAGGMIADKIKFDHKDQLKDTAKEKEISDLKETVADLQRPNVPSHMESVGIAAPVVSTGALGSSDPNGGRRQTIVGGPHAGSSYNMDAPVDDFDVRGANINVDFAVGDRTITAPVAPDPEEIVAGIGMHGVGGILDAWEDPGAWATDVARNTGGAALGVAGFANRALDAVLPYSENVYGLATLFDEPTDREEIEFREFERYGRLLTPSERNGNTPLPQTLH